LQMAYDQIRPAWMRSSQDAGGDYNDDDRSASPKTKPVKRVKSGGNQRQTAASSNRSSSNGVSNNN